MVRKFLWVRRSLCLVLIGFILLTAAHPVITAGATAGDNFAGVTYLLDQVITQYPDNSYWKDTFDGANTCYGFAKLVTYQIFGKSTVSGKNYRSWLYNGTSSSGMEKIGTVYSFDSASMKQLLSQARPGDILQFNTPRQHSIVIYSVNSDNVTIYESNVPKYLTRLHTVGYDYWEGRNSSCATLLRSDNYDEVNAATGFFVPSEPASAGYGKPTIRISSQNTPGILNAGSNFGIRGVISTDCGMITSVKGEILSAAGSLIQFSEFDVNEASHDLRYSINRELVFGGLSAGNYIYRVSAEAVNGTERSSAVLIYETFSITAPAQSAASLEPVLLPINRIMRVDVGRGNTLRFCSTTSTAAQFELGSLPDGAEVYVYGTTEQKFENRTWAKISYNGTVGWVNYAWIQ